MKNRQLIGKSTLDLAINYVKQRIPISTAIRLLKIDQEMHYRTAFNIIKADMEGLEDLTRPNWLKAEPKVQSAPDGWRLTNGFEDDSHWTHE